MLFERLVSFSRFIAVKIPEATTADISEGPRSRKCLLPPTADVQITRHDTGMGDADRVRARMMQMRSVVSLLDERFLKPAHELQSRSTCGCPPDFSQQFSHNFVLELNRLSHVERSIALNLAAIARDVGDDSRKTRAISSKTNDFERHLGPKTAWRKEELRLPCF